VILGFTNMSIVEVIGIDGFRRFQADVEVTADDVRRAKAWEASRARRTLASRAPVVVAPLLTQAPAIDGRIDDKEWPAAVSLEGGLKAAFQIGYDKRNLYLCWTGQISLAR
jgi:hypothetical protein